MTTEDEEFNRIEREASLRKAAVRVAITKKEWIGLTDEEMYLNCPNWLSQEQCKVWIKQIEVILKERNT
jgi:hypothetical protein